MDMKVEISFGAEFTVILMALTHPLIMRSSWYSMIPLKYSDNN